MCVTICGLSRLRSVFRVACRVSAIRVCVCRVRGFTPDREGSLLVCTCPCTILFTYCTDDDGDDGKDNLDDGRLTNPRTR